tara:strand:- start:836 stop:2203 length:1368 start_codon:yes stop_codon:yes gene_type:complete
MSLLRFGRALGETLRGLPENQLVMGGLGLMSANQPGQAAPVDQPGSFLKGMLSANALRQNRLLQEEKAKEKERQEAQRVAANEFFKNVANRPQMVADRNLALQMQQQQELAQMQTPFNAADMRATLPADMQARSIGDAGPQTAIHTASPVDVPPVPTITEMAFASGVPGIRNKAFEAVLEQNKNRGDLGLGSVNPRDFTTASLGEYAKLIQSGAPKADALQVLERTVERRDFVGDDGRTYSGAYYADGTLRDSVISPQDPLFKANATAKIEAAKSIASIVPAMDSGIRLTNKLLSALTDPEVVNNLGTPLSEFKAQLGDSFLAGSPYAEFARVKEQLEDVVFLSERGQLKGGGSITDYEGDKAANASIRMNNSQTPGEFREAAIEFIAATEAAKMRVQKQAEVGLLNFPDIENIYNEALAKVRAEVNNKYPSDKIVPNNDNVQYKGKASANTGVN